MQNRTFYSNFHHGLNKTDILGESFTVFVRLKACVRYFSLFSKDKCISSLFRTKYVEKKFNLVVFSSHCFTNIYSLRGYHALPASLKRLV